MRQARAESGLSATGSCRPHPLLGVPAAPLALAVVLAGCAEGAAAPMRCEDAVSSATDTCAGTTSADAGPPILPACQQVTLSSFVPEAARFAPGARVELRAELSTSDRGACIAQLALEATELGQVVARGSRSVELRPHGNHSVVLGFQPPQQSARGYLVRLSAAAAGEVRSTAVDVSPSALSFPRYGYLSSFPPGQTAAQSKQLVATLVEQYHLNMYQLYDWFWRHEDLLPEQPGGQIADTWRDLFGRENSRATLEDLIGDIHENGGLALAYVAMYAAREGYEQLSGVSPAWGLYETPSAQRQVSLQFGDGRALYLFDPSNAAWQERMASQYGRAIDALGFDGVQIDQFGPRPTLYRADGSGVELDETFAPFLESIDRSLALHQPGHDVCVFNIVDGAVGGYAVDEVTGSTACDLLYSEIWFTTDTYQALSAYADQLRRQGGGRPVVLAMYPQYGEDVGLQFQAEQAELQNVAVARDHSGFSGSGFVAEFDAPGDAITWNIDVADAMVSFVFRYANASGQTATRTLVVDGQRVGKLRFFSRESWDDWAFDAWLQQRLSAGEHEVRLEYADDDRGAVNIDRLTLGAFNEASLRLQNAVVFASGATPIQIGDDEQSLAHEYFPNRSKSLSSSSREALRRQYTFITAHERLLFESSVVPIENPLQRVAVLSGGHRLTTSEAGAIWTSLRRTPVGDALHLVNLVGVDNDRWRDPAPQPEQLENIALEYRVDDPGAIHQVLWATPDAGTGEFQELGFSRTSTGIRFTVPQLQYWDVVLLRR